MRASDKGMMAQTAGSRFFGADFRDMIEKESESNGMELGVEFGLTPREARNLKKRLERS